MVLVLKKYIFIFNKYLAGNIQLIFLKMTLSFLNVDMKNRVNKEVQNISFINIGTLLTSVIRKVINNPRIFK